MEPAFVEYAQRTEQKSLSNDLLCSWLGRICMEFFKKFSISAQISLYIFSFF